MAERQCEKCGEFADHAKAFCPACGAPFIEEEKRSGVSDYDAMDSTVQLGQTMYNQMLSDMGLNVSKAPDVPEKRIEVVVPAVAEPTTQRPLPTNARPNSRVWIWVALALVSTLLLFAVVAAVLLYLYFAFGR